MLVVIVNRATGYPVWRKTGIQTPPAGPYSTIFFDYGKGFVQDVVEYVDCPPDEEGNTLIEVPWGTMRLRMKISFFRNIQTGLTAFGAAIQFKNSLQLQVRYADLWQISGLVGDIEAEDITAAFRADIEPRAEVRFGLYANLVPDITKPLPEGPISTIDSVGLGVTVQPQDATISKVVRRN